MKNRDSVECFLGDEFVGRAVTSMVPPPGAMISIRKQDYIVERVTYALDYADSPDETGMRAVVALNRRPR
jgi:hypothetical protein